MATAEKLQGEKTMEKEIMIPQTNKDYQKLIHQVGVTLEDGRKTIVASVNNTMVQTYWSIGKHIVDFEQKGHVKAEYGTELFKRLSRDLTERYGKGFSHSNLIYIRKLYLEHPKSQTLSDKLSWSHYIELLKIDDPLERQFYRHECEEAHWGVRELKRQMKSMLFHRLALSTDKEKVLRLAQQGEVIEKPEDILRDPYVFEFTGLPRYDDYTEGELEDSLYDHLSRFLLELGKGFAFIGRQQKVLISGRIYKVDLVFYHRILKCFVLIDLKRGEVTHEDVGQMNFYLNYFREEMNTQGDTEPIGIILGAYQDKVVMKYALQNITNQLFVSKYQLYLPDREQLEAEFQRFMENQRDDACEGE